MLNMLPASLGVVLVVVLAMAWLVVALGATLIGIRRARDARNAVAKNELLGALLAAAPEVSFLASADGRIGMNARTAAWLGLDAPVGQLGALAAAGFTEEQLAALGAAITAARDAATPIALTLVLPGFGRCLAFSGGPLVLPEKRGTVVVWIGDISGSQARIDRLGAERDRLGVALDGLSGLIEAAPFPIWHRDAGDRLVLVNRAYVAAVEGRDSVDVVRRELELIEETLSPAAAGDGARLQPAIVGGQRRMMRIFEVPIAGAGSAGFAIDVQELDDARADLLRFGEAQRAMLDRLSAGVAQFAADRGLIFYNSHFRRLFNLDVEALDDRIEFDDVLERMREAGRAPESRDFRAWRAERCAWFNSADAIEESWLLPGGTHLRVVAQPLPDGGLLVLFEDRSEHFALASARDTLLRVRSATFDNLFEGVGVFAADGRIHLWNHKFWQLWGLEEAALLEHPHLDSLVQAIAPKLADPRQAGLIRELVRVATIDRQHRAGRVAIADGRHFEFAAVPLPDGNALFALLDVTASYGIEEVLRNRNETLEETNQLRARFVAQMSYELRVPLTSISGFAEMLAGGYTGALTASGRDYVEAILRAVDRLQELIGDALDLSQSELGSLALATAPLDIGELVRETARLAAGAAMAAGVRLGLDITPAEAIVLGDHARLRRCLDHLVRNALEHTPPKGQVLLTSRIRAEWAEIIVSDTGIGIGEADRARLLDSNGPVALASADGNARVSRRRRGVGLPLARQLVEVHGGTLLIDSEPGKGTSVIIHLPLAKRDG